MKLAHILSGLSLFLATQVSAAAPASSNPKLVVVVVVDQMRSEYLKTMSPYFGQNGFRKLMKGAVFANAHHEHIPTYTAAGHATIATGTVPHFHGIVSNSWYERESKKEVGSVSDENTQLLLSPAIAELAQKNALAKGERKGASPQRLREPAFSDRLKDIYGGKSIGISLKDRSAVLSVGKNADLSLWYDAKTGSFVSSTYYQKAMPNWVNAFNNSNSAFALRGKTWDLLLPRATYGNVFDISTLNRKFPWGIGFPKKFEALSDVEIGQLFELSPNANSTLVSLALDAVDNEKLGADDKPDVLVLSFSTPDIVGHTYSTNTLEVRDIYARLDRDIERFLTGLEKRVGKDFVLALSADHGVSPLVEESAAKKQFAIRIKEDDVLKAIESKLDTDFGAGDWVENLSNDQIFLNYATLQAKKLDIKTVAMAAGTGAKTVRGIRDFVLIDWTDQASPRTRTQNRIYNGAMRGRSGDLTIILEPLCLFDESYIVTTHGSGYAYDTHVPLVFYGRGVRSGTYVVPAAPMDIVPTFSALMGINSTPSEGGKILDEAF